MIQGARDSPGTLLPKQGGNDMKKESIERIVDEIMSMLDDNVTSGDVCAFRCWCQDGFTFDNEEPDVRK